MSNTSKARLLACTVAASAAVVALAAPANATQPAGHGPKQHTGTFFTGGSGTGGWATGNDALVPGDRDGKVVQLSSPDGSSWAGFQGHALDGLALSSVSALSYDFAITSAWSGGGGGSPRLVVALSDGGNVALNSVDPSLTTGTWVHMDAIGGAVDNSGGCGYLYQASWNDAVACHPGATVTDAYVVVDSGWMAPMTVQVDNVTMNSTVYTKPGRV
jgi:hypothetical protein